MRRMLSPTLLGLVLLATASAAQAGYVCPPGTTLQGRKCSDGSLAVYQATEVKPYTRQDRDQMLGNINGQAKENAAKWQKHQSGLNQQQLDAIQAQTCLGAAAANSDLRCVRR